jgi:hypothetical protein
MSRSMTLIIVSAICFCMPNSQLVVGDCPSCERNESSPHCHFGTALSCPNGQNSFCNIQTVCHKGHDTELTGCYATVDEVCYEGVCVTSQSNFYCCEYEYGIYGRHKTYACNDNLCALSAPSTDLIDWHWKEQVYYPCVH